MINSVGLGKGMSEVWNVVLLVDKVISGTLVNKLLILEYNKSKHRRRGKVGLILAGAI